MKDFEFDIDEFVKIAKEYGAEITEGTGKITIDGKELNPNDIFEYMNKWVDKDVKIL